MRIVLLIFMIVTLSACSIKPKEIEYGADQCVSCKMTIVDRQHAAELVTKKGKVFMFDSIECMVRYFQENQGEYKYILVSDYMEPGTLTSAEGASYLISKNVPSPMGAFLSAFSKTEDAQTLQMEKGGRVLDWQSLNLRFEAGYPPIEE